MKIFFSFLTLSLTFSSLVSAEIFDWDQNKDYNAGVTVVVKEGNNAGSYRSLQSVSAGTPITSTDYWYNLFLESNLPDYVQAGENPDQDGLNEALSGGTPNIEDIPEELPPNTDTSTGGGDTSTGGGDTSTGGGDTNTGGGDTNTGGGDTSTGGGDTNSGGGDTNSGGGDTNSGGGDTNSGGGDTNTGGGDTSVVDLINISTNGYALTGAEIMSAGFIISGSEAMTVYIKAEKSQEAGITPLSDPKLEIWDIQRTQKLAENDNWGNSVNLSQIQALDPNYFPIEQTDSAVLITLQPGAYIADVFGSKGNSGKALVAVNNVDNSSSSKLINISTNGYAYTGEEKMSAGFIITGTGTQTIYIKAEKSQEAGITPLSDPKLEIWNIQRTEKLAENDNWGDSSNLSQIEALHPNYYPIEQTDSAVILTLGPGAYVADVYGAKGNSGKALVAVNLIE
jgi:hypothetical protein